MRIVTAIFFVLFGTLLFSFETAVLAETSLSLNHRVISATPVSENGSDVTLEVKVTNTGTVDLSSVTISPSIPQTLLIFGPSAQPLSTGYISVNDTVTEYWAFTSGIPADYSEMVDIMSSIIFFEIEAVTNSGETIQTMMHSESLDL